MPKDEEEKVRRGKRVAPKTGNGNELRATEFPPVTWAVPDILPAGVTLFGGREKMGKSWLAFGLCIAVATGGYVLGKIPVEPGAALYLSLEDPWRRLHNRLKRLVDDDVDLGALHLATEWEPADREGVEDLDAWLAEHEDCRVVAIDTLKMIRPRTTGKRNPYEEDYEAVQPFTRLAAKHNVSIVILHHLNQQSEPHDPFDAFSGSAGLTAAMDTAWLLTRKRGKADAFLVVDGKDIEEPQELALGWDPHTCSWTNRGDAESYRMSETRKNILRVVAESGEPVGPMEVAEALGMQVNTIRQRMYQMSNDGELKVVSRGKYVVGTGPIESHNVHNFHNKDNVDNEHNIMDVTDPRLQRLVAEHAEEGSLEDFLMEELYSFTGEGWEQEDDITLLTLQRPASLS
jgi:hypothetical protein